MWQLAGTGATLAVRHVHHETGLGAGHARRPGSHGVPRPQALHELGLLASMELAATAVAVRAGEQGKPQMMPALKPTRFLSSSLAILNRLSRRRQRKHQLQQLLGSSVSTHHLPCNLKGCRPTETH